MTDMAHKVHHHTARGYQPGLSTRLNMLGIDCEDILYRAPNIVMISIERIISGEQARKPDSVPAMPANIKS